MLYRATGLSGKGPGSGIVAFDVSSLKIEYGVPVPAHSKLHFYDSPSAAVAALRNNKKPKACRYTKYPAGDVTCYIGSIVRAVRITLTGTTLHNLPGTSSPATYTVNQTVGFWR